MIVLALLAPVAAFALFALASEPHGRRLSGGLRPIAFRRRMRVAAWALLALAFLAAIAAKGWVFGPVLWSGSAMLGAGIMFVALNLVAPARKARAAKR